MHQQLHFFIEQGEQLRLESVVFAVERAYAVKQLTSGAEWASQMLHASTQMANLPQVQALHQYWPVAVR